MQAPAGNRTRLPAASQKFSYVPLIPKTNRSLPPGQTPAGQSPVYKMANPSPVYEMVGWSPNHPRPLFSSQHRIQADKPITVKQAVAMFNRTPRVLRAHPGFTLTWISETARPKKHGTRLSSEHVAILGMSQINVQRKIQKLAPFEFATIVYV